MVDPSLFIEPQGHLDDLVPTGPVMRRMLATQVSVEPRPPPAHSHKAHK